jgi:hypothetical protein
MLGSYIEARAASEGAEMDRREINRALAKAIAYKNCGKDKEAAEWARQLVELLECAEILATEKSN